MQGVDRQAWTWMVLSRCALVSALIAGLCGMHVIAAAMGGHRAPRDAVAATMALAVNMPAVDAALTSSTHLATSMITATSSTPVSTTAVGVRSKSPQGMDAADGHGSLTDCVPYLAAGAALLLLLMVWAFKRSQRSGYRVDAGWIYRLMSITPWRGPPPRRWPRIALCVIRV